MPEGKNINGRKVAHLRKARGWSQRELAEKIGMTQTGINNVEHGYRQNGVMASTSVEKFIRMAEVLETSLDYLADRTDDAMPPASLDRLVMVVADTQTQAESLRCILASLHRLSAHDVEMAERLIHRLSEASQANQEAALRQRIEYLIRFVTDVTGIDPIPEIERRFGVIGWKQIIT